MTEPFLKIPEIFPLIGECRDLYIEGEIVRSIWNGKKWLPFYDVYPLMYFVQTGRQLDLDEE